MASAAPSRLVVLAISMVLFSSVAMATDFVVGGEKGWTLDFNYTEWAQDKVFHVGDNLLFNYDNTKHNVVKVNGTQFQECSFAPDNEVLSSGKDTLTLKAEGKKWYACGKANHCADHQMKFAINVLAAGPAPAPSSANSVMASLSGVLVFAIAAIFA
ncbi:basic blue protein [Cajanus cajan]|uniref:Mavicyanin n=1 Tax=Cajanus cajan TaxID=3821 RepID=A0A151U049_CAJCA|nr:basic blue protein [Cajanus cajan]KYP72702.1 Mavicyanin [Cajanus cajan]